MGFDMIAQWDTLYGNKGGYDLDPITHGLIGAALCVLSQHPLSLNDPVFLGTTIGAMLPDMDIVTHVKGRLNYLLKHRGASHSLLALTGISVCLTSVLYAFFPSTPWNTIFFWTLVGTLSHGVTDLLNSFGAELLWPFVRKKLTIDMIILTDPVIFGLFLTSLLVSYNKSDWGPQSTWTATGLSVLYLIIREADRRKIRHSLQMTYHVPEIADIKLLPAMYRPFDWNFLILQEHLVRFGVVRNHMPQVCRTLPRWDEDNPYVASALDGALAEVFDKFTPYYHIVSNQEDNAGPKVEFMDLRYWNKEAFLYTGQVVMDEEGQIAEETFYPFTTNQEGILLSY